MSNEVASMVKLIESLSLNSQDDTDPSNIILQKFQSPTEQNCIGESVQVKKWVAPYAWVAGSKANFTRSSITNNPFDGTTSFPDTPRFLSTPFGKGLLVEEPTTNYCLNSDFSSISNSPGLLFSSNLTVVPDPLGAWSVAVGGFTYGANGATAMFVPPVDNLLLAGNKQWKAVRSGTQNVPLRAQITITTGPTSNATGDDGSVYFYADSNNYYKSLISNGGFYFLRTVNGVTTQIGNSNFVQLNNQRYCINLSIDANSLLSTQLYLNDPNGTLIGNLSVTDTTIPQGFSIGCGSYKGVSVGFVSVWGPMPDHWITGSAGAVVASIGPSITTLGSTSLQLAHNIPSVGATDTTSPTANYGASLANSNWALTFTASCNVSGTISLAGTLGAKAVGGLASFISNSVSVLTFNVANVPQVFTIIGAFPAGETATQLCAVLQPPALGSGIVISYGGAQLENSSHATTHHRNDSYTATSSRTVESLSTATTGLSPVNGTINLWALVNSNSQRQSPGALPVLFTILNAGNFDALKIYHASASANWYVKTSNNAGSTSYGNTFPDLTLGWHMFTLRWSASTCELLVDGALASTVQSPLLSTAFAPLAFLGGSPDGISNSLDSVLADVTVFTRTLTTAETLAAFMSNAPLPTDTTTVLKLPLNGDLSIVPITTFNWNQGGFYTNSFMESLEDLICLMLI